MHRRVMAVAAGGIAALAAAGHELFLHARLGEVEVRFHDTRRLFGHAIEIHRKSKLRDKFWAMVKDAARAWDGQTPLRPWR